MNIGGNKLGKVIQLPGTVSHKPILNRDVTLVCPSCGNTDGFLFRIYGFPLAIVGKKDDSDDYEIKEMVCRQDGTIGEEILCCMKCGCIGVEVVDKKDMPKIYAALEERENNSKE